MTQLPDGWRRATLGEVGRYHNGRGFKKSEWRDTGRPIIRIQNLTGSSKSFNYFQGEADERYVARSGDLLVSWAATLGAYLWNGPEAVVNQHIFKVESNIDKRFHKHLLDYKLAELMQHTHGSGMVHITRGKFDSTPVALPPAQEQRRIVEILDDHLSRLDAAEAGLRDVLRRLDILERAVLQRGLKGALVSDDFSEGSALDLLGEVGPLSGAVDDSDRLWSVPDGWAWARLGDLFAVNVGSTPSRANPKLWDGKVPWVSSGEVAFNRIASTRETISEAAVGNRATRLQPPGTVMLAMIGEGKTRGQAAILDVLAAHNQNCASIRVSDTKVLPEFVFAFLKERYLETRRAGSGGNQTALNKRAIQRIPVPVPPLGTQRLLIEAFREISVSTQRLRESVQAELRRAGSLRRALLASAFSGKLTGRYTDQEVIQELAIV